MATGGNYPRKTPSTEPRSKYGWQRTTSTSDKDDNISLNSIPNELRPNNWDFSDWKPTASIDNTKRRKKGNPEREREQSLSLDSPPLSERNQRTPSTFPRTRITPSTPTSQRIALEKLRQQLTFSDLDDVSNDGEKNNERNVPSRRGNLPNFTRQDIARPFEEGRTRNRPDDTHTAQNNTREEGPVVDVPDSGQIVGRLMQIREYIKQANTMMDSLRKPGAPQANLEEVDKLRTLIDNLQEQERAYLGLLQELLSFKGDPAAINGTGNPEGMSRPESREDTQSIDLEVQSETSEATTDNMDEKLLNCFIQGGAVGGTQGRTSAGSRPRIEDKLGLSDEEDIENSTPDLEETLLQSMEASIPQEYDYELNDNLNGNMDGDDNDEELQACRQQQQLLRRLHEQQEQMRALKGRQAALLALQRDAEQKLAEARKRDSQALAAAAATVSTVTNNSVPRTVVHQDADTQGRSDMASDGMPREIQDIRQQLSYLRNELKEQNTDERQSNPEVEAAASSHSALDDNRRLLQEKMTELQEKKQRMDSLLRELNNLRNERFDVLTRMNNGAQLPPEELEQMLTTERQGATQNPGENVRRLSQDGQDALSEADNTMTEAQELQNIIDAREKLRKLQEVKDRLNQLRSLVQYYQSSAEQGQVPEIDERTAFQNMIEEYNSGMNPVRPVVQESGRLSPLGATGGSTIQRPQLPPNQQKSDEDNASDSDSSQDTNLSSSLGPWGDDPEIQAKVRKLKAAKEKLKQLQNIVTMVQRSPNASESLPENLEEVATSMEDREYQLATSGEGETTLTQQERDSFYEAKMQEQMRELDQLKEERRRLLAIQNELQTLHDKFGNPVEGENRVVDDTSNSRPGPTLEVGAEEEEEESVVRESNSERPSRPGVPVVTFSSNDEVYGKMRKQRMLREELRQKKRELEDIMKKDCSRKQYGKNQDNQSDTVSYTTDAFGATASVDATMATWGGSTVDNLESITEDEDAQAINRDVEEEDDAYPSDGIVQVEEEEEENDSDNETYTIEDDLRQRRHERSKKSPAEKGGARPKQKQTYPRSKGQSKESVRSKQATWNKSGRRGKRVRQENFRSAEDIVQEDEGNKGLGSLQQQLERTATLCQTLLSNQNNTSTMLQPTVVPPPDSLQQQLQQQQLMLSLNQCLQQMAMQQMEIQSMQRQMQCLTSQVLETDATPLPSPFPALQESMRLRSTSSLLPPELETRRLSPAAASGIDRAQASPQFNTLGQISTADTLLGTTRDVYERSRIFEEELPNNFVSGSSRDQHKMAVKKKTSTLGRGDAVMKRKTSNLSDRSRNNVVRQRLERDQENVPPLNLQQSRKKRVTNSQNNRSTASFASSKHESGHDVGPDVVRGTRVTRAGNSTISQRLGVGDGIYRPGLSAGISGAGFQMENSSVASTVSNRAQGVKQEEIEAQRLQQAERERESDDPGDLSLFEALRESIYSEVATLISQNENRPHFLIEIFRELQLLTTDYLRQRVLYSIKDIVSKNLTEQGNIVKPVVTPLPAWMNTNAFNNCTASELTPSESILTSDDEEIKMKVREIQNSVEKRRGLTRGQSLQNDQFDYEENADNDSSLSTPSNSYWENPFAQDSLGDTAIHLDKALKKMKEFDQKIAEEEAKAAALTYQREQKYREGLARSQEPTSSSAVDQGSESSVSSMSVSSQKYPKIDTQQLDQQIKSIMSEVIPVIKEHMDQVCSPQLLAYIKRLVLSLTQQQDSSQYSRFFHNQLSSALHDCLAKFEGRKMRQCGEDLLVDMSEVLFNELAFFRLMEGIGEPPFPEDFCTAATQTIDDEDGLSDAKNEEQTEESDTTESSSTMTDEEELNNSVKVNATEEEDLGKARDDEFACDTQIRDSEDKDEDPESPYKIDNRYKSSAVQIELAQSETKPFTRIGSDEDDEDADESQSADDPSETAVSRDAMMERSLDMDNGTNVPEEELSFQDSNTDDADQGAVSSADTSTTTPRAEDTVQVNGEVMENGEVTVDDLPPSLNVVADQIKGKMSEEQQSNSSLNAVMEELSNQVE